MSPLWLLVPSSVAFERAVPHQKGSLLVFPHVELGWTDGVLDTDTFVQFSNDFRESVRVQVVMTDGECVESMAPADCSVGIGFVLGPNGSTYVSLATGQPAGFIPFSALDPMASADSGRQKGFLVAWAIDDDGAEIRWNHLSGQATIVSYAPAYAWSYAPWAFQTHQAPHGDSPASCVEESLESGRCLLSEIEAGRLDFDGFEYESAAGRLGFNFFAIDSHLSVKDASVTVADIRLSLLTGDLDFRTFGVPPSRPLLQFEVWNQNETRFSGLKRPVDVWADLSLQGLRDSNFFLRENLQTDFGRSRVRATAEGVDPSSAADVIPLLGIVRSVWVDERARQESALPMSSTGFAAGVIRFDTPVALHNGSDVRAMANKHRNPKR